MLIEHPRLRDYIFRALDTGPVLVQRGLSKVNEDQWDHRYDHERFTLREVVSHLADWETIFQNRFKLILSEDSPPLPTLDPGQLAIDGQYSQRDPFEQIRLFKNRRSETIALLEGVPNDQWVRSGIFDGNFHISIEGWATSIPRHDLYHLRQISDWTDVS